MLASDYVRRRSSLIGTTKLAERYGMELRMDWVPELCAKYKLKLVDE